MTILPVQVHRWKSSVALEHVRIAAEVTPTALVTNFISRKSFINTLTVLATMILSQLRVYYQLWSHGGSESSYFSFDSRATRGISLKQVRKFMIIQWTDIFHIIGSVLHIVILWELKGLASACQNASECIELSVIFFFKLSSYVRMGYGTPSCTAPLPNP